MGNGAEKGGSARAFFRRILLKTAVRSLIWCAVVYLIVDRWPTLSWLWYGVALVIIIGIAIALVALAGAQREADATTDEQR